MITRHKTILLYGVEENILNEYLSYRFVGNNGYGKVISREYIERFALEVHGIEPRVNVPKLEAQMSNLLFRRKDIDNKALYKSMSDMIIRNYKKANRGQNDGDANARIRRFIKDEIYGSIRVLNELKVIYGGIL